MAVRKVVAKQKKIRLAEENARQVADEAARKARPLRTRMIRGVEWVICWDGTQ